MVRIVSGDGTVVASTRSSEGPPAGGRGYLAALRGGDFLWVDAPRRNLGSQDWTRQFGRRLKATDGTFAGAVLLAVDASYFVSGYDDAQLGKQGTLGLLGTDGVFRARRTGDTLSAGDVVNYALAVPGAEQADPTVSLTNNNWDGIRRYTSTQQLFEFPLAVIVGLSEVEQLAAAHHNAQVYLWRAAIASGLLVLLAALLGRMSWQLARSRVRESDAKLKHAQRIEYRHGACSEDAQRTGELRGIHTAHDATHDRHAQQSAVKAPARRALLQCAPDQERDHTDDQEDRRVVATF